MILVDPQNHLRNAFDRRNKKVFEYWLEHGDNPDEIDHVSRSSTFEHLCKDPDGSDYILKCLEYKTDPNMENPYTGLYPIHLAVQHLCVSNTKILLNAEHYCSNQIVKGDKTPLHYLADAMEDKNLRTVFEIIKLFSEFHGMFWWPARRSDNQTPFQMMLEKMANFSDRVHCLKIIRFLIERYKQIDRFQRDRCEQLINSHFKELVDEYQEIAGWQEEPEHAIDWRLELEKLILENEAEFLIKLDTLANSTTKELKDHLLEGTLFLDAIQQDRFAAFVAIIKICGITSFHNINGDQTIDIIISLHRYKFLKHIFDLDVITNIEGKWMVAVVFLMEDKESGIDPNIQKCFHILLDHPKYDVNAPLQKTDDTRAITFAAYRSKYAMFEMLKKGASLDSNNNGVKTLQFIEKDVLKNVFDSCITKCIPASESATDYYLTVDFAFLEGKREMPIIEYIADSRELKQLICHPVVASFLFLKWLRLTNIFYLNLLFFSLNALCFSTFLSVYYVSQDHQDATSNAWFQIWRTLAFCSLIVFVMKESIQLIGAPKSYLCRAENYFELGIICLMIAALFIPIDDHETRRTIAAVLFLGLAIEWTLVCSTLPLFSGSNYIVMLKKVAANFLRTLAFYSVILLAFAVSFHTLVNDFKSSKGGSTANELNATQKITKSDEVDDSEDFNQLSIFAVFVQTILMMNGDFASITEKPQHFIIGRIFLLLFVFSMTVVLMNLLIGLTVSDTSTIESEAEWHKWSERTKLLGEYETTAFMCHDWLEKIGLAKKIISLLHLMPGFLPMNKIKIEISSQESNQWIYVPKYSHPHVEEKIDKTESFQTDIEGDPFPLVNAKKSAMNRSYFGFWKVPIEMDQRIIDTALEVVKCNQLKKSRKTAQKELRAERDEVKRTLDQMKQTQLLLVEKLSKTNANINHLS